MENWVSTNRIITNETALFSVQRRKDSFSLLTKHWKGDKSDMFFFLKSQCDAMRNLNMNHCAGWASASARVPGGLSVIFVLLVWQTSSLKVGSLLLQLAVVHVHCVKLRIHTNLSPTHLTQYCKYKVLQIMFCRHDRAWRLNDFIRFVTTGSELTRLCNSINPTKGLIPGSVASLAEIHPMTCNYLPTWLVWFLESCIWYSNVCKHRWSLTPAAKFCTWRVNLGGLTTTLAGRCFHQSSHDCILVSFTNLLSSAACDDTHNHDQWDKTIWRLLIAIWGISQLTPLH